jgi:Tfp pilus assembly PilM family ATPase
VRLSLDFFENEFDRSVASVMLSGGGSRLTGLVETLELNFKKPTQLWDLASGFALNLSHGGEEVFSEKAPQMAISLGLAARLGRI